MRNALLSSTAIALCVFSVLLYSLNSYKFAFPARVLAISKSFSNPTGTMAVNLSWFPPSSSWVTNLGNVINGTGVYGFIFNSSTDPPGTPYGTYNWCNMPHVRPQEYKKADAEYKLEYVELV